MLENYCDMPHVDNGKPLKEWTGIRNSIFAILESHACTYAEALDILQAICDDLKADGEVLLKKTQIADFGRVIRAKGLGQMSSNAVTSK